MRRDEVKRNSVGGDKMWDKVGVSSLVLFFLDVAPLTLNGIKMLNPQVLSAEEQVVAVTTKD